MTGAGGPSTEAILKLWSSKHELFFTDAKIDSITPQVSSDKRFLFPTRLMNSFCNQLLT